MVALNEQTDSKKLKRCARKFRGFFPRGFRDPKYFDWERVYKDRAYEQWQDVLNRTAFENLLKKRKFHEIASLAVGIEARTFASGLFEFLYGSETLPKRLSKWCQVVGQLPRKQTRVLTWPGALVV